MTTASSAGARGGAVRAVTDLLLEDHARGFALRVAILVVAMLVVAVTLQWLLPRDLRLAAPVAAALMVGIAYLWRPAEALFALAVFVAFYETTSWYIGSSIKRIDEVALLLLGPVALWRALARWRAWWWWPRELGVAVALAMGVVSSLLAGVPFEIWIPAFLLVAKPLGFFYIVLWSHIEEFEARGGIALIIGVGAVVAVLGLVELLSPSGFQQILGLNEYIRMRSESVVVKSVFVHPALYGYFTSFVALLLLARYLVTRQIRWLIAALLMATGAFLSARRRAILALAGGVLAGVVGSIRLFASWSAFARTWLPAAVGSLVLVVAFMPLLTGLYALTAQRYGVDLPGVTPTPAPSGVEAPIGDSDNPRARIALYTGSLDIAQDYVPLGAGLGRYGSWMSRVEYSPLYEEYGLSDIRGLRPDNPTAATDTFWPQILGELGVIGFVGYAVFLACVGWILWREAGRDDGPELRILRLGAGMVFAQGLVESAASAMFHSPSRMYLLVLVVGMVASLAWHRDERAST